MALGGQAPPRSATVILIDKLNTRVSDQRYARDQLIEFLKLADPQDRIAILSLTADAQLRVLADFTATPEGLRNVANADRAVSSHLQRLSDIDKMDPGDEDLAAINADADSITPIGQRMAAYAVQLRAERTLRALEAIGRNLANVPGRKNLIWISSNFPFSVGYEADKIMDPRAERQTFGGRVARASRVLTDANVAVYPINPRGTIGNAMGDAANWNSGYQMEGSQTSSPILEARQSMESIAQATGGKAFYGRNDISTGIRQAFDDSRLVYILGYQPSHDRWDGKYRPIEVKVRRSGVKVRCRRGYFALAEEPEKQRQASLLEAIESPLDATALGLIASVSREQNHWKAVLIVDAQRITLALRQDHFGGRLDVLFVQENAERKQVESRQFSVPLDWTPQSLESNLQHGARFNWKLDLVPSATRLRIVVRDGPSGRIGSIVIPLAEGKASGGRP